MLSAAGALLPRARKTESEEEPVSVTGKPVAAGTAADVKRPALTISAR